MTKIVTSYIVVDLGGAINGLGWATNFISLKNLHIICCEKKIAQPKISLQTHSKF